MRERFIARIVVRPVVQVIYLDAFQQGYRVTTDPVGGAVVDIELAGPATNADPLRLIPALWRS